MEPLRVISDKSVLNCSEFDSEIEHLQNQFVESLSPIKKLRIDLSLDALPALNQLDESEVTFEPDQSVLDVTDVSSALKTQKTTQSITVPHRYEQTQSLKFHVASNYSLHPARSPVPMFNLSLNQFHFKSVSSNIYKIFGAIYTLFAIELSIQQKEELNRSILFPLKSIGEAAEIEEKNDDDVNDEHKKTTCHCQKCCYHFHRIKFYLILLSFLAAMFMSMLQIITNPSNQRLLLNACCILWFLRYFLILISQRKCILTSYTAYIQQLDHPNRSKIDFNWLEILFERISSTSQRGTSEFFNKKVLSYAFILSSIFVFLSCTTLGFVIFSDHTHLPIVSDVLLSGQTNIIYTVWIYLSFLTTICLMMYLLPSFVLSCVIVTNRFKNWKSVIDNSNELEFIQIRSYIFHGRHLLHIMNEQWSSYLTITLFTTIPHILLNLYTLVLTECRTNGMNQLFGWLWIATMFIECSITCYFGANVHKKFELLSKSVVDLGSRNMIQGDEQFVGQCQNKSLQSFFPNTFMEKSNQSLLKSNSPNLGINLLLLLISSMNSIDGISVGGIFTLNFGVITTFLSALFTLALLFIELTRSH